MLDLTKPVQTRDGRKVRIFVTDANFHQPIIGEVDGERIVRSWSLDGHWLNCMDNATDLVNVPETQEVWVNVYREDDGNFHATKFKTKELADQYCGPSRVGCHRITLRAEFEN